MMEISENLHRADLTFQQRAEQIEEWRRLASDQRGEKFSPLGGRQPGERGVKRTARELGIAPAEVRNAEKIASLSPEAKAEAVVLGFDNKQSVLLAAKSADADPVKEVAYLRAEHARREAEKQRKEVERANKDTDRVIALTASEQAAERLLAQFDVSEVPAFLSECEACGSMKDFIAAVRRAMGDHAPTMDRRYG